MHGDFKLKVLAIIKTNFLFIKVAFLKIFQILYNFRKEVEYKKCCRLVERDAKSVFLLFEKSFEDSDIWEFELMWLT